MFTRWWFPEAPDFRSDFLFRLEITRKKKLRNVVGGHFPGPEKVNREWVQRDLKTLLCDSLKC